MEESAFIEAEGKASAAGMMGSKNNEEERYCSGMWRFFGACMKSYNLVELYESVQGEGNEGKRVCGADRGCGGIEDAERFAGAAGAEAGDGVARAFAREADPAAVCG